MKYISKRVVPHILKHWHLYFVPVIFVFIILVSFNIYFLNKSRLNIIFANESYSGLEKKVIAKLVQNYLDKYSNNELTVVLDGKKNTISFGDLGVNIDQNETAERIYEVCRDSIFYQNWLCDIRSILKKTYVKPVYSIDFSKLNKSLDDNFVGIEKKAINAQILFDGDHFIGSPAKKGQLVDRSNLITALKGQIENYSNQPLIIQLTEEDPTISQDQISNMLDSLNEVQKKNISLVFGFDKWNLSGPDLLNLINTRNLKNLDENKIEFAFLDNIFSLSRIRFDTLTTAPLFMSLDEVKVDSYMDNIAKTIDRPTRDAVLSFENGKVIAFNAAVDGQILDREQLKKLILKSIQVNVSIDSGKSTINLPVKVTQAKITNNEVNNLGIKELIGSGVSYFAGSIPNRVSNIALGSKLISGTLVKPGETFSFVGVVGAVSAEQGFKQAYVINKGKTVLDDGGGICQVSTTVFRAALNSGLPIIKRTAHAYRVGYYEQHGFKPGLDATIFSPSVDFQFKNDTQNYVLVQAVVDRANSKLQVDIFGTNDGRRVELGNVSVSNIIPAPEPLYQDDLTLPAGTVKQVEYSANGASTLFSRKVYKDGQIIIDESFKSVFRPWQAVFLVGKG